MPNTNRISVTPPVILLAFLLLVIYAVPFCPKASFAVLYRVLFTAIIFASVFVVKKSRKINLIVALAVIAIKWGILLFEPEFHSQSNIPEMIFFGYIVGLLLLQIASIRRSSRHLIIDCVNGYFLTALVSALLIGLTASLSKGSFNFRTTPDIPLDNMNDYIYHALVVFTTTGFGDIVPVTVAAKSISNFISVSGQLYVAIIITLLIGHYNVKNQTVDGADKL
jgi:voltage-gated potassium channel